MKILKAKTSHPKKQIFQISDLVYIESMTPLKEILDGQELIDPIQIIKHEAMKVERMGAQGIPYIEKRWSVYKGSQRIQAAKQLGYTHIEGVIINESN